VAARLSARWWPVAEEFHASNRFPKRGWAGPSVPATVRATPPVGMLPGSGPWAGLDDVGDCTIVPGLQRLRRDGILGCKGPQSWSIASRATTPHYVWVPREPEGNLGWQETAGRRCRATVGIGTTEGASKRRTGPRPRSCVTRNETRRCRAVTCRPQRSSIQITSILPKLFHSLLFANCGNTIP
jgi:hypothetical protein